MTDLHKISRALISVSNKTGIVPFARALTERGIEILSTGGTAKLLQSEDVPVTLVSEVTEFPEMLNGRVKTLHPRIHGGILADRAKPEHIMTLDEHGIPLIDLVVVNLYPFEETAKKEDATEGELIEQIDIGGPTLIRAAAKNFASVTVVTDPEYYGVVELELNRNEGATTLALRRDLFREAFLHTARYDMAISNHFEEREADKEALANERLPKRFSLCLEDGRALRYGENSHQRGGVYTLPDYGGIDLAGAKPLQGKQLSFNNLLDADAALFALHSLMVETEDEPGAVVIKHTCPCGAARADSLEEAWMRALSGDPKSAFGGIVALSQEVDGATAKRMSEIFLEVVVAPGFSEDAREIFGAKKNLRLIELPEWDANAIPHFATRSIMGGMLVQSHDRLTSLKAALEEHESYEAPTLVTERAPTEEEWRALDLAYRLCAAPKSNCIVLASPEKLLAAGAGQSARIDALEIANNKAIEHGHDMNTGNIALGSDAFFPFPDCVQRGAEIGVTAIVQPGGSKKDQESIDAANRCDIAMVFTGTRHFRH